MTNLFDKAFEILIGHEGGYVNDPHDRGGETKYGISKRAYPNVDIRNLTLQQAKDIYRNDYWDRMKCDSFPPFLAVLVFDAAVNNGVGAATRWLQLAGGVTADGIIGPKTIAASFSDGVAAKFHAMRVNAMTNMPTWPNHGRGWAKRLAALPFEAMAIS
jgi:lysozyme family protein